MPTRCLRTLMTGLIDYAGLFPPARLAMSAAVETYNRARMGEYEWMLGRFICPASRLEDFTASAAALLPGTYATSGYRERADIGEPWELSVLVDSPGLEGLKKDLDRVDAFNRRHSREDAGLAMIDMIEVKVPAPEFIDDALEAIPEDIYPFFEFPLAGDCRGFVAALAGNSAGAKIRTGGLTPELVPCCTEVAAFLEACTRAEVPFKATAGLHHPVRSEYPLDTAPGAPRAVLHGFLNLFVAAGLVRTGDLDGAAACRVLEDRNSGSFRFTDSVAAWHDQSLDATELAQVREHFAMSFGSCSFDEPVEDLKSLRML